jgi:hypothetical protein
LLICITGTEKPALYVSGNLTNFAPDSFSKLVVLTGGAVETVSDTLTATPTFTFDIGGAIPNIESIHNPKYLLKPMGRIESLEF